MPDDSKHRRSAQEVTGALRQPPEIQAMFDGIVGSYDRLNRIMSGGRDVAWRRAAARIAVSGWADRVLDLASGTGDLALELVRQGAKQVVGLDLSREMLRGASGKIRTHGRQESIHLTQGNAMQLPFADDVFDACTVAFGLRNMPDYSAAIAEMARVTRPSGRVVVLEMVPPRQELLRGGINWYFDRMIPLLGRIISDDPDAYRYLPRSVAAFPRPEVVESMMQAAGLDVTWHRSFALGTVGLIVGLKTGKPPAQPASPA